MKNKFLLAAILIFSSKVILGWEITSDLNVHGPVNSSTVNYFINFFKNETKYKLSSLDNETTFLGVSWHSGLGASIAQNNLGIPRKETFKTWVEIGGVDADIDSINSEKINYEKKVYTVEKPLRHFYDPEKTPRYLTDCAQLSLFFSFQDPKMDHIQWALRETSHRWSFDQALFLYKAAMEIGESNKKTILAPSIENYEGYFTSEKALRENLFAASFRALGETLHCMGDLCLPAHVRDDSHAGIPVAGGTDNIERGTTLEMAEKILKGSINSPIDSLVLKGKTVEELLIACAQFTNQSFFSNDTICDADLKILPRTTNGKQYSLPSFSSSNVVQTKTKYKEKEYVSKITKTISNNEVVLAELTLEGVNSDIPKYVVPRFSAEGHARVLLPLAVVAGAEIVDRFFPTMKLTMTLSETGKNGNQTFYSVNGTFNHQIENDPIWATTGAIKYNGEGELLVNDVSVATINFVDGVMTTLTNREFKNNDKVQLRVKAGGLIHTSEIVPVSVTQENAKPYKLDLDKGLRFDTGKPEIVSLSGTTDDGTLGIFYYLSQIQVGNYQYRRLERGETMVKYGGSVAELKTVTEAPAYDSTYKHFSSQTKNSALATNDLFYFYLSTLNQYGAIRIETVTDSSVTFYLKYGSIANNRTLDTYSSANVP